jgi:hypothetical protein
MRLLLVLSVLVMCGCAVAPFATEHSALPLGEDQKALDLGLSPAPYAQMSFGVNPDLDVGGGIELQFGYSIYAWAKYSLMAPSVHRSKSKKGESSVAVVREDGFALAVVGGGGLGYSVLDTVFLYTGPIGSWRSGGFEFYVHPRLNYLMYEGFEVGDDGENDATKGFDADGGSFTYVQISAGAQYFFVPEFALGLSGLMFPPAPDEPWRVVPGINLMFRF